MNLNNIFAKGIPDELKDILAGQITIFVPISGIDRRTLNIAQLILQLSARLNNPEPIIQITPTTYQPLCGCLVGRTQSAIGDDYPLLIGNNDCLGTFLAEFWGISLKTLTDLKVRPLALTSLEHNTTSPISKHISNSSSAENLWMHELTRQIPTLSEARIKLEEAISVCVNQGYDIDIEELKKKIEEENRNSDKYELKLELSPANNAGHIDCNICISINGKNTPLNITAIHKTIYLAFLLHKDGLVLNDITMDFVRLVKNLYQKMPDRAQDDYNGIMGNNFSQGTMNGYRSEIRDAIKEVVKNSKIVDRFAIEGYRGKPYMIMAGTDEIREQIKDAYGLS